MLDDLRRAHRGTTTAYYLDIPFDETVRRHTGRPQATEFTAEDMRAWYLERDLLGFPSERVISTQHTLDDTAALIAGDIPTHRHAADGVP
jgi:hypothetical protein